MTISIVIPTYKRPEMLAELLVVLAPQLTDDADPIIVDNDASQSARAVAAAHPRFRYVAEPRNGVVHARNRGVAEARGTHIIFLDDDEVPAPGWFDAFAAQARSGVRAGFGRIVPRYTGVRPAGLGALIDALFSREADGPTGTDITALWAYLGTGNAIFDKAWCFPDADPFDIRFNASGGEDIWMIRGLMARGCRLMWNREALVEELVPPQRTTLTYLKSRKFVHGQQRVIFMRGKGGVIANGKAALWMAIGAAQAAGFTAAWSALAALRHPRKDEAAARVQAGLGKLLWWRAAGGHYSG